MSFRNNLQHLRATRGMTQEQLAMLLGVSRQSVTKWEAEKSYPEMDKLIKLCEIFDCTLDDLVTGDLTGRDAVSEGIAPELPVADICGYDEHMRNLARHIAWGAALCAFSPAPMVFFEGLNGQENPVSVCAGIVFIAAGCASIIPAAMDHSAFVREHPIIADFYSTEDRREAHALLSRYVTGGVVTLLLGLAVMMLALGYVGDAFATSIFLACVGVATWFFVWGAMMYSRIDVDRYNREASEDMTDAELEESYPNEAQRLAARAERDRRRQGSKMCAGIMIVATIIGLTWLFVGRAVDPMAQELGGLRPANLFWLSWVVGGLLCALVRICDRDDVM